MSCPINIFGSRVSKNYIGLTRCLCQLGWELLKYIPQIVLGDQRAVDLPAPILRRAGLPCHLVCSPLQHLLDIALVHLFVLVKDTGLFVRKRMPGRLLFILEEDGLLGGHWGVALPLAVEDVPGRDGASLVWCMHVILPQLVLENLRLRELVVIESDQVFCLVVLLTVTDGLAMLVHRVGVTLAAITAGLRSRRVFRELIVRACSDPVDR